MRRAHVTASLSTAAAGLCAIAIVAVQLACGGSDCTTCPTLPACPTPEPTPTPTPTPEPTPASNGYWRGIGQVPETQQYQSMEFTLADNQARNLHRLIQHRCSTGSVSLESIENGPWPLANRTFTVAVSGSGWSGTIVVSIDSDTRGTATWSLVRTAAPCAGTGLSTTFAVERLGPLARQEGRGRTAGGEHD